MARARLAAHGALLLFLLVAATASAVTGGVIAPLVAPAAVVGWPPSPGLLLAEVVTGGASASDEYVELTNGGATPIDLAGIEVAYVTASGATVTRKASWAGTTILEPGRHLLLANALGSWATVADATYSGGLAGTGGALVVRPIGGAPIDAVGWGDATNAFVEGSAAPAPPAGASIERGPGGVGGNVDDTNDNASDFLVTAAPSAQNLAAPPAPAPAPSATPDPTSATTPTPDSPTPAPSATTPPTPEPSPTAAPTESASPEPSISPTPEPSATPVPTPDPSPDPTSTPAPTPTATASPAPTPAPTPDPTPAPTATPPPTPHPTPEPTLAPTAQPTWEPSPSATPAPSPEPTSEPATPIGVVRALPDGSTATVEGVLTMSLGAVDGARGGFVQDDSAGIGIYLDASAQASLPAGTRVRMTGTVDNRYSQRILRVAEAAIADLGPGVRPLAVTAATGDALEALEGLVLEVRGTVTEAPATLADGTALTIDDGSGPLRLVITPGAQDAMPARGDSVVARGPLGQRDSSGTGQAGYRLYVTVAGDLAIVPPPSPTPGPSPTATPGPTATPDPTAGPTPAPTPPVVPTLPPTPVPTAAPTPAPSPTADAPVTVASARTRSIGQVVRVQGTVTAEAGRLGTPPLLVIQDETAGIVVRLPDGAVTPPRGSLVDVRGPLADPYGQLEIRPATAGWRVLGGGVGPEPQVVAVGALGEGLEARLVTLTGVVTAAPRKATSGDVAFTIRGDDGMEARVYADAAAGIATTAVRAGDRVALTGVVGQRASRKGALDGYRLWLRDAGDLAAATAEPTGAGPGTGVPAILPIGEARLLDDRAAIVEGTVTAGPALLDTTGRRIVMEDRTGAIEVLLPAGAGAPRTGARIRVSGTVGRAYGAPRLRADGVEHLGSADVAPLTLRGAPGAAHEWRLVRVSGTLEEVRRLGERWAAELRVGAARIPVIGLAGSGIPSTALVEGRVATVTGIVRRPYPSATDRRFGVVPRGRADLAIGPSDPQAGAAGSGSSSGGSGDGDVAPAPAAPGGALDAAAVDADLGDLESYLGRLVRVGGLIVDVDGDVLVLDDGTAVGRVLLSGAAAELVALLAPGDAVNAIGRPEHRGEVMLVVDDPAAIHLVGGLGEVLPMPTPAPTDEPQPIDDDTALRASVARGFALDAGSAGLGTLLLVGELSVAMAGLQRHRARRRLQARIVARIEALTASRPPRDGEPAP